MIFPIITEEAKRLPFYVAGVGSLENQHDVVRISGLRDYQFLYTTKGKGHLQIGNKNFIITEEMGFCFAPNVPHEYYALEEPWTTWWVTFSGYAVKDFAAAMKLEDYFVFYVNNMDRLNLLHHDIHTSVANAGLSSTVDASCNLYKFFLGLRSCISTESRKTGEYKSNQLQPVLVYLEDHYDSDITLSDMANIAGVSQQHLCRLFKQTFHMRPFEYLARCRIQNAKALLTSMDNLVLKEIASKIGFNDVSYFCSVFKQYEGMTPIEFRRMHREF
jgi:AraC-like DNA-binding protein